MRDRLSTLVDVDRNVGTGRDLSLRGGAFSQPTLLGINVGLTIEPLAQATATPSTHRSVAMLGH